ncbi:AMP-binding protein, partial [Shewanella sp.]|uniref:AMP-binding protein n=1 Tax=Shewanella sp. TaxID=50422 RepID=UPI003D0F4899
MTQVNIASTARAFDMGDLDTFPKILRHNAANWGKEVAMREKEFGIWTEFSWQDYHNRVKWMALAFDHLGIKAESTIALLGENRPEWVWGEVAAHALACFSLG